MAVGDLTIRLVVLDWAGTTVDHGSCAPVAPFVAAFARSGVEVSPAEARGLRVVIVTRRFNRRRPRCRIAR